MNNKEIENTKKMMTKGHYVKESVENVKKEKKLQ